MPRDTKRLWRRCKTGPGPATVCEAGIGVVMSDCVSSNGKGRAGKKELDGLMNQVRMAEKALLSDLPFLKDQVEEGMEKIRSQLHIEAESSIDLAVTRAGLRALAQDPSNPLSLDPTHQGARSLPPTEDDD